MPARTDVIDRPAARSAMLALILLVPAPSLGIWMAVQQPGVVGKTVFFAAKIWVLLLPVVWLVFVDKGKPSIPRPSTRGMLAACLTGSGIVVAIVTAYRLIGPHWIDAALLQQKVDQWDLGSPGAFLAGAVYWCTFNSLAEEYVWRWFAFTRCEALFSRTAAVIVSGLLFTLHHIIALSAYFEWRVVLLASLGIWIGGATWSWLYLRYRNIWTAYVSHVFADVAVFGIGYLLVFG